MYEGVDGVTLPSFRDIDDVHQAERTPVEVWAPYDSTYELLRASAERFADRPALTALPNGVPEPAAETWTYAELFGDITRAANLFHALGVAADEAVTLLLPSCPQYQMALWGAEAAAIANPVNPMLGVDALAGILHEARTRIVVTATSALAPGLLDKVHEAMRQVPEVRSLLVVGDGADGANGAESFDRLLAQQPGDRLHGPAPRRRCDTASYFHTGGTTGTPKLVRHTHGNEVVNAWQLQFGTGLIEDDVFLNGLPLFHGTGAILGGIASFFVGAQVVLAGPLGFRNPAALENFWRTVHAYRITCFVGVPTVYGALLDVPCPEDCDITSLRFGICGAAPMPRAVFERFVERTGVRIIEGYGMTESCAGSALNPRDGEPRIGSIGLRLPHQQIRVVMLDENGGYLRDAESGESGLLLLRGPNITPGYTNETANRGLWLLPGWLNTGDTARQNADGYLWLTGRQKDLIIRSGHNIDPAVVETAVSSHPDVELAAAVGKPDAYAGELPAVYVQLRPGASVSAEALREHALANVDERPAAPVEVVIVDAIPTTAVGKIFKPPLRRDMLSRTYRQLTIDALGCDAVVVEVKEDEARGTVVHIYCPSADAAARKRIEAALHSYPQSFELYCGNAAQPTNQEE